MNPERKAEIFRKSKETEISGNLNLDTYSEGPLDTGSPFLDHMLDLFRKHSGIGLALTCKGDKEIDMHHSTEDIGIAMGMAFSLAIGGKKGIERYGFYLVPMDEALARVALDLSGRISFEYHCPLKRADIGNMETELIEHFFKSFAHNAKMNLHIDLLRGFNTHHSIEAIFKAFARALAMAICPSKKISGIPSTKGTL